MDCKIITIATGKGGVGKTAMSFELGSILKILGKKVLCIDLDASFNLSIAAGADLTESVNIIDIMKGEMPASDCIQNLPLFDLISGDKGMANIEAICAQDVNKLFKLKEAIDPLRNKYEFIIIDTPPTISLTVSMALVASDYVLIPLQAKIESRVGLIQNIEHIKSIQKYSNPSLKLLGIVNTIISRNNNDTKSELEVMAEYCKKEGFYYFNSQIRQSVALSAAHKVPESIVTYDAASGIAQDYMNFTKEFIKRVYSL